MVLLVLVHGLYRVVGRVLLQSLVGNGKEKLLGWTCMGGIREWQVGGRQRRSGAIMGCWDFLFFFLNFFI